MRGPYISIFSTRTHMVSRIEHVFFVIYVHAGPTRNNMSLKKRTKLPPNFDLLEKHKKMPKYKQTLHSPLYNYRLKLSVN
jgi:hypothetical protein